MFVFVFVFAIQQPFANVLRSAAAYFCCGLQLLVGVAVALASMAGGDGHAITSAQRCSSHEKWSAFRKWLL